MSLLVKLTHLLNILKNALKPKKDPSFSTQPSLKPKPPELDGKNFKKKWTLLLLESEVRRLFCDSNVSL